MLFRSLLLLVALVPHASAQRGGAAPKRPATPARPAPITIASNSQLTIDGNGIHNETFPLTRVQGDWFATANDAHASLRLQSVAPKPPVRLDIAWFGKQSSRVINEENNTDQTGDHMTFFLRLEGSAPYDLVVTPGSEGVTVTVSRIDDHDLEARIAGAAGPLRLNGTISLHRDAVPFRPTTGTYGNCDNVIYDKMYGAQSRSPSDCEVRLDGDVRRAASQSLARVMAYFRSAGWIVENESPLTPIASMARSTEKNPFRIDFAGGGGYSVTLKMNPASAQYQAYRKKVEDVMQKFEGGGAGAAGLQELQRAGYQAKNGTEVRIAVEINMPGAGISNFQSEHTVLNVPGAAYAVFSAHAQAPTGGGLDNSEDRALVLLGAWAAPKIEKLSDGGEQISVAPVFDKSAPTLSVQNILIRIQANQDLVQNILRQIDLAPLAALVRK